MQVSSFHFGPHKTPTVVKTFLILTCALSLLSPLASFFLQHFFHMTGPQTWLPLSLLGIFKGWIWQPATYFFINSLGNHISLSLLFSLLFYVLLFWFTG